MSLEEAYAECARITRREARNFAWGIMLLPRPKRVGLTALYAFARDIGAASGVEALLRVIVEHVGQLFNTRVGVFLPEAGRLVPRAAHPPGSELLQSERATASWVWEHNQPAGPGTDTLPGGEWLHVPLGTVSTYAYVNPVVAIALGVLFLDEALTTRIAIGAAIVLGSVAIVVRQESDAAVEPFAE